MRGPPSAGSHGGLAEAWRARLERLSLTRDMFMLLCGAQQALVVWHCANDMCRQQSRPF